MAAWMGFGVAPKSTPETTAAYTPPIPRKVVFVTAMPGISERFARLAEQLKQKGDRIDVASVLDPTGQSSRLHSELYYARVIVFGKRTEMQGEDFGALRLEQRVVEHVEKYRAVLLCPSRDELGEGLVDDIIEIINGRA